MCMHIYAAVYRVDDTDRYGIDKAAVILAAFSSWLVELDFVDAIDEPYYAGIISEDCRSERSTGRVDRRRYMLERVRFPPRKSR